MSKEILDVSNQLRELIVKYIAVHNRMCADPNISEADLFREMLQLYPFFALRFHLNSLIDQLPEEILQTFNETCEQSLESKITTCCNELDKTIIHS